MLVCTVHAPLLVRRLHVVVIFASADCYEVCKYLYFRKKREKKKKNANFMEAMEVKCLCFFTPLVCRFVYIQQTSLLFWAHCKKEKRN